MDYTLTHGMWDNFWFRSIDARQYAALRIAFGGLSAVYLLGLLPFWKHSLAAWVGWEMSGR